MLRNPALLSGMVDEDLLPYFGTPETTKGSDNRTIGCIAHAAVILAWILRRRIQNRGCTWRRSVWI
jgi:hypothetical protein